MTIKTNDELKKAVNTAIAESGVTKTHIASKLNLTRQGLDKMLQKKSFSLDDANKILNLLHMDAIIEIKNE